MVITLQPRVISVFPTPGTETKHLKFGFGKSWFSSIRDLVDVTLILSLGLRRLGLNRPRQIKTVTAQNFTCYLRCYSYVSIQLFLLLFSVCPTQETRVNMPLARLWSSGFELWDWENLMSGLGTTREEELKIVWFLPDSGWIGVAKPKSYRSEVFVLRAGLFLCSNAIISAAGYRIPTATEADEHT